MIRAIITGLLIMFITACMTVKTEKDINSDVEISGLSKEYWTLERPGAAGLVPDRTGYCEVKRDRDSGESVILFIGPDDEVFSRFILPEELELPLMTHPRLSPDDRHYYFFPMQIYPWAMVRARRFDNLFVIDKASGEIKRLTNYVNQENDRIFIHNLSFSRDATAVIYNEWDWSGSDGFTGVRLVSKNLSTGKSKVVLEMQEEVRYFHSLEVGDGLYLMAASAPGYALPTDVYLYDERAQVRDVLFSMDEGCENAFWIRDYSRDHSRVLLCHFVYTDCAGLTDIPFDLFFTAVYRLTFLKDGSMTIGRLAMEEGKIITNAKMTPEGRYCVYTLHNTSTNECTLAIHDFDTGESRTLLSGNDIVKETGEGPVRMGFPPAYRTMSDGLFLSDTYDLMVRINDVFHVYVLERKYSPH